MSANYFKAVALCHRFFATLVLLALITAMIPTSAFAEDVLPIDEGQEGVSATSSNTNIDTEPSQQASSTDETASSTENTTPLDGENASSTEQGGAGSDGTGQGGAEGEGDSTDGDTSTTTATTTPPTQPNEGVGGTDGVQAPEGSDGSEAVDGSAGATPDDEVTPVEITSDALIGDPDAPEEEEVTGDVWSSQTNTFIETGIATAQGELETDANSNDIRSELEDVNRADFDTCTFTATGTNDAQVSNDGLSRATTGDNYARGRNTAEIHSGDAVAVFNIANVINTNVINSDGFIYLANKILEEGQSLDLTDTFFPDTAELEALSDTCSLLSCTSEDVVYNVSQMNHATITNSTLIESVTGHNETAGVGLLGSKIHTGNAYAAANMLNVVNSNIIDSNYRLLTYNAIGDLDGDLVLPTEELFDHFFSRPNGTNQVENAESVAITVTNENEALIDNDVEATAETGLNDVTTDFDSVTRTGRAESESNILNKINENTYGGDSLYMLIRIHGSWDGDIVGLPEGLTWEWTPDGIIIYNVDAEIAPSALLGYDVDSYVGNFTNNNRVVLENNLTIDAVTGENTMVGMVGELVTGDAFASANVMNIANTNVIGTNWTMAIVNILGDFEGNISFEATDISLSGSVSVPTVFGPGAVASYTYTVTNNSNTTASNIWLDQVLENAHTNTNETTQRKHVGTLAPNASKQVTLSAIVDSDIAYGTTSVTAFASVSSDQGDVNNSDNLLLISKIATHTSPDDPDQTGTTTPPVDDDDESGATTPPVGYSQANYYSQGSYSSGGGGGGGGSSSKKKKVEREEVKEDVDPNAPPILSIKKTAVGIDPDEVITAGESVDYVITVTNTGGNAYDAEVFDTLKNPIGSIMNEQSWDLDTILPGEEVELTYTTEYSPITPSGTYTNTAHIKAYLKDGMKESGGESLAIKDAVHEVQIKGLDLAIGNVAVLAYFPGGNGMTSALVTWETSKPSLSQVFFGVARNPSLYNANLSNFGYQNASFKFPTQKTRHAMIINNLQQGLTHAYRIHAQSGPYLATSREHFFMVPARVASLTIASPASQVAGATATVPGVTPLYTPPPIQPPVVPVVKPPAFVAPAPQTQAGAGSNATNPVKSGLFKFRD